MLGNSAELVVACSAELDGTALSTLGGDRTSTGQALQAEGRGEAASVVAEFGKQGGCQERPCARQRTEEIGVRVLLE